MRICFPVKNNEGVKSVPYGHFGTAPTFVICDLEKDEVTTVGNGDNLFYIQLRDLHLLIFLFVEKQQILKC